MIEAHHSIVACFRCGKEEKSPLNKVPGEGGSSGGLFF